MLALSGFLAGSALRTAAVSSMMARCPFVRADRVVGLSHEVFISQPGDLLGPHGRARLVFLEQGQRLLLERGGEPHDLADRLDNLADGLGTVGPWKPGHLGVDILGQLDQDPQAFGRTPLIAPVVGRQPARGLVGRQRILLALGQGDDVKVADVALEPAEPRIAVLHELLVDPDGRVDRRRFPRNTWPDTSARPGPRTACGSSCTSTRTGLSASLSDFVPFGSSRPGRSGPARSRQPPFAAWHQEGAIDLIALDLARVVFRDEAGEFLVGRVQGLDGLGISLVGLGERRPRLRDLGLFLRLVRRYPRS